MTGMTLSLILIVPVGAASSIVVSVIVLALLIYFLTDALPFRQRLVIFAFGLAGACAVAGVVFVNLDAILGMLGRDTTLTGRTAVWSYVLQMSAERPLIGYGYAAFFEAEPIARYVMDSFDWAIPTAHNGYLEALLGLGWIGLVLLLVFFVTMAYRLTRYWQRIPYGLALLALPMLIFYMTLNLTESTVLASSGLSWIVLTIAALSLTPGLASRDED